MFQPPDLLWPAGLSMLGAIFGSFLATIAIRWPQDRSVMHGRSECDACGRTLTAQDLVPLLSALASHGRCRTCSARIDPTHWRVELAAMIIGALAGLVTATPIALAGALFGWLLLILAVIDLTDFWLPDELNLTLALAGFATGLIGFAPLLADRLIGGLAGFGSLWLIGFGYQRLRGREGLGGGDPKLFGAIGLWLGWRMLPAVLLIAALVGLAVAALAAMRGRDVAADTEYPFGAFLAIAAYPAWLVMIAFHL